MDKSYSLINSYLDQLKNSSNKRELLDLGISLANEIMNLLGAPKNELLYGEEALNNAFQNSRFGNQKIEQWFEKHPYMGTARIALYHYKGSLPIESNFFQLSESATKAKISAITQLTPNWEDSSLTMLPNYKVGVDFFLAYDASSLKLIITSLGNLRVLELSDRLSNTQIEIFENIKDCLKYDGIDKETRVKIPFEPQRTIHRKLWDSFELQQVNRKFYVGVSDHFVQLYQHITSYPPKNSSVATIKNDSKLFASRLLGRLLFLWFLKKKKIINSEMKYFEIDRLSSEEYYETKLKKLFFDVLNTPLSSRKNYDNLTPYLNGGLFEPHLNDWSEEEVHFPSKWFENLFNHFNKFNFTTDESTPDYEQLAIDPEMLGRVFENLLASIRPETEDSANERSNKGAFYTPREIVSFMNKEAIKEYIKNYLNNIKDNNGIEKLFDMNDASFLKDKSSGLVDLWGKRTDEVRSKILSALEKIKILDPAVGSGAFPIGMLQLLVKTYERLNTTFEDNIKSYRLLKPNENFDSYNTKLFVLKNNLYGVDIEPMAIEIARLRSWLSLIVDVQGPIEPLPNLDFNLVCANTLLPLDSKEYQISIFDNFELEDKFNSLISDYFVENDKYRKNELKNKFKILYNKKSSLDKGYKRINQLKSWNPFETNKPALFFDSKMMFNIDKFNIVIGNPPYIRNERISIEDKQILKANYKSLYDQWNLYVVFFENGINQLTDNGLICFISPNQWLSAKYGQKLREIFAKKIVSLTDFRSFSDFEASVNTFITLASSADNNKPVLITVFEENGSKESTDIERKLFFEMKNNLGATLSKDVDLINKIKSKFKNNFRTKYKVGHSFSIPDFYKLAEFIEENSNPNKNHLKLVNTGTLSLNGSAWGTKQFRYSKKAYKFPVISVSNFIKLFPTRKVQAGPKLIIASMGGLKVDIDLNGNYLGTRPTIWVSSENADDLKISFAILNSSFINWFYREQYSVAGMTGFKIRFSHIADTPLPEISSTQKAKIIQIVDKMLNPDIVENSKQLKNALDKEIYEIYCINSSDIKLIEKRILEIRL